jgi:hypothetical protein
MSADKYSDSIGHRNESIWEQLVLLGLCDGGLQHVTRF